MDPESCCSYCWPETRCSGCLAVPVRTVPAPGVQEEGALSGGLSHPPWRAALPALVSPGRWPLVERPASESVAGEGRGWAEPEPAAVGPAAPGQQEPWRESRP